jgi:hypothetical protein
MIFFEKSNGEALQEILDSAKSSDKEDAYRSGDVFDTLKSDFCCKCYLCEDAEVTVPNVEHFEPHKGNLDKKYDWHNLFYACGHCNNLKQHLFWPLLNCTDKEERIWEAVEIRFVPFPKPTVEIIAHPQSGKEKECTNTCRLLEKCLTGRDCTAIKKEGARALRRKMTRGYTEIYKNIRERDLAGIKGMVDKSASFAGMFRWLLRNEHPDLFELTCGNDLS